MSGPLQIQGAWPNRITYRRGWYKATARAWNETTPDAAVRLERGTASFLTDISSQLQENISGSIYSPALYRSATRIWSRASYQPFVELTVMERRLSDLAERDGSVIVSADPDMAAIEALDRLAFDSFWHMGAAGLAEAVEATPHSAVLTAEVDGELAAYAIVGAQMGISYLQRIATRPDQRGQGLGKALVVSACHWGRAAGAITMVLNVKPDNHHAMSLYARCGFGETANRLRVLRYEG